MENKSGTILIHLWTLRLHLLHVAAYTLVDLGQNFNVCIDSFFFCITVVFQSCLVIMLVHIADT